MAPADIDTQTTPEGHRVPGRANLDRYRDDAGVQRADAGERGPDERPRAARPPRAAGPTHDAGGDQEIAERDSYALDGAGIRRIVRQGDPVPQGFTLLDEDGPATTDAAGDVDPQGQQAPSAQQPEGEQQQEGEGEGEGEQAQPEYADRTVQELDAEVGRRREAGRTIDVTGSGKRGAVVQGDLVAALEADDAAAASEQQA